MKDLRITADLRKALTLTLTQIKKNTPSPNCSLVAARVRIETSVALAEAALAELDAAGVIQPSPFPDHDPSTALRGYAAQHPS